MLNKLTIRNFKRFDEVTIELGNPVVFIGPNNSGKTTALQALALWHIGLKRWMEKRKGKATPDKRPGITINRRDLLSVPVPSADLLWRNLHVRDVERDGKSTRTKNIRVDVVVEGVSSGKEWTCGLEFDYANPESFYCRPLRMSEDAKPQRMVLPHEAEAIEVAFLPPMSGLAEREFVKQVGEVGFLIGQGRTAEVLRNLCFQVAGLREDKRQWEEIVRRIKHLFGVELSEPRHIPERSEIAMSYKDLSGTVLDLSSSGRGLQQTLLLLAYMAANPGAVLLLDEPDAHLEILRQREIYGILSDTAREQGSQIVAASHSEVMLNEAADRDVVIAFIGKPHRIDDRGSQLLKSLKEIGYEQYYQAEETGWVLYLEGSTDLAILQVFAETLGHQAAKALERPFVHYVQNQPQRARDHFGGLCEAKQNLRGILLCDHLDRPLQPTAQLGELMWTRREIENYLCQSETLLNYAQSLASRENRSPLFDWAAVENLRTTMQGCIDDFLPRVAARDSEDPWWTTVKASDGYLDRVMDAFFEKLKMPNIVRKSNYHLVARYVPKELFDPEITVVLDTIVETASNAAGLKEGDTS